MAFIVDEGVAITPWYIFLLVRYLVSLLQDAWTPPSAPHTAEFHYTHARYSKGMECADSDNLFD